MNVELGEALGEYDLPLDRATAQRPPSGLIQVTWLVDLADGRRFVAQRMHPIFGEAVLGDIEAVTAHLAAKGLATPRLVRARDGRLGVTTGSGLWRVLTHVPGETVDRVTGTAMAGEAGALVARFHRALEDLQHSFAFVRAGVHDTAAHLGKLQQIGRGELAERILRSGAGVPSFAELPRRIVHGDLKISNLLFAGGRAVALIDLDTVARMPLAHELGDALRSWCNPLGEDTTDTRFDLDLFAAAVRGYAGQGRLRAEEAASIVPGLHTICVELAARFCVDAFEDRYFGWDPARFASRQEHNLVRSTGQIQLAEQVQAARADAERVVREAFGLP